MKWVFKLEFFFPCFFKRRFHDLVSNNPLKCCHLEGKNDSGFWQLRRQIHFHSSRQFLLYFSFIFLLDLTFDIAYESYEWRSGPAATSKNEYGVQNYARKFQKLYRRKVFTDSIFFSHINSVFYITFVIRRKNAEKSRLLFWFQTRYSIVEYLHAR